MVRISRYVAAMAVIISTVLVLAGCGKPSAPTVQPQSETVGVLDMNKAIQAHPQYSELQSLQDQIVQRQAQIQALGDRQRLMTASDEQPQINGTAGQLAQQEFEALGQALDQDIQAQLEARKTVLNQQLQNIAQEQETQLSAEMGQFEQDLNKQYEQPILNLQLKLKTVQLAKADVEQIQNQLKELNQEKDSKLETKKAELQDRLNQFMTQQQQQLAKQLDDYQQQLVNQAHQSMNDKQLELQQRLTQQQGVDLNPGENASFNGASSVNANATPQELADQIQTLSIQAKALQQKIEADVKDKIGKVATEKHIAVIVGGQIVNVQAVDITDSVISEIKKISTGILK